MKEKLDNAYEVEKVVAEGTINNGTQENIKEDINYEENINRNNRNNNLYILLIGGVIVVIIIAIVFYIKRGRV